MSDEPDESDVPPPAIDAGPPHPHDQADNCYGRDRGENGDGDDDLAFSPGDLVNDRDKAPDDRGTMVVLRYPRDADGWPVVAEGHEFMSGTTVHDVNEDYPADDPVVEVAFEGWLDSHVPAWRGLLGDARELGEPYYDLLAEFCHEWGVSKRTYSYPESRLVPRPWCELCREKAEYIPDERGYFCRTDGCRAGTVASASTVLDTAIDATLVGEVEAEDGGGP